MSEHPSHIGKRKHVAGRRSAEGRTTTPTRGPHSKRALLEGPAPYGSVAIMDNSKDRVEDNVVRPRKRAG